MGIKIIADIKKTDGKLESLSYNIINNSDEFNEFLREYGNKLTPWTTEHLYNLLARDFGSAILADNISSAGFDLSPIIIPQGRNHVPDYSDWAVINSLERYRYYRGAFVNLNPFSTYLSDYGDKVEYWGSPFLMKWDGSKFLYAKIPDKKPSFEQAAKEFDAKMKEHDDGLRSWFKDYWNKHFAQNG